MLPLCRLSNIRVDLRLEMQYEIYSSEWTHSTAASVGKELD